jgi:hypothetical protein
MRFLLTIIAISCVVHVVAQTSTVTATQDQDPALACTLQIFFDPGDGQQKAWFGDSTASGAQISNYRLFVVLHGNSPDVRACDKSDEYLDSTRPADSGSACVISPIRAATCPSPGKHTVLEDRVYIPLLKPLRGDLSYLVVITGVGPKGQLAIPLVPNGTVITPDVTTASSLLKVQSNISLSAKEGQTVNVKRSTAKGLVVSSESFPGHVLNRAVTTDGILIKLDKKLPSGKDSQLTVDDVSDYYGSAVSAKGKITIAGAPVNATDAFITTSLAATAGVHASPAFSATGAIAPWHPAQYALFVCQTPIRFDPSATFDVGSASTQSKDSIIFPAQFAAPVYLGLPSLKTPRNSNDLDTPFLVEGKRPSVINFLFGPRAEIDTKYGGVNLLGSLRSEWYLLSLSHAPSVRQAVLGSGNPAIRNLLELPNRGYAVAPYLEVDGGGHITSNTVSVGASHADVPTYGIGRLYIGLYGSVQAGILSFSVDSSWVDLLSSETIGYTTKTAALLRIVSGWQPNTTAAVSITFDQAKHYGFTLNYQNGRSAPNFQYLNKFSAGVKITY